VVRGGAARLAHARPAREAARAGAAGGRRAAAGSVAHAIAGGSAHRGRRGVRAAARRAIAGAPASGPATGTRSPIAPRQARRHDLTRAFQSRQVAGLALAVARALAADPIDAMAALAGFAPRGAGRAVLTSLRQITAQIG